MLVLLFSLLASLTVFAGETKPMLSQNGTVYDPETLMKQCAPRVATITMGKLTYVESTWNAYAININHKGWRLAHQPRSKAEAVATLNHLLATYGSIKTFSVDVGVGQINSRNFRKLGIQAVKLFDPCENLRVAEIILVDCYQRALAQKGKEAALPGALSCYNSGNFSQGFQNGYVSKVYRAPVPRHRE